MKLRTLVRCWFMVALVLVLAVDVALGEGQAPGGGPPAYSLNDCVQLALERSPRIRAAEDAIRKAEAEIGMAKAGFYPRLTAFGSGKSITGMSSSGNANEDYDDQTILTHGLQLTQTLFAGLTILNGYQRAVLAHEYVLAERNDTTARLALQVQTVFLERLQAVEQAKVYEAHLQSLEINGRALEAMFAQHLVPYSDVLDTQAEIASARQKLSEAENIVAVKTIELKGLMQVPFEQHIAFADTTWDTASIPELDLAEIRAYALSNKPAIVLSRLAIQLVQKDKEVAMGGHAPRVNLTLSYNNVDVDYDDPGISMGREYNRDYRKDYHMGMLSMEWDLFQGGRTYHQVQRIKHEISRLQNNLRDQESMTYTEIEKSYTSLQEARGRARHAMAFVKSSRENLAMAQARLDKSLGTLPELVLARSKVQNAESTLVRSYIDCQQSLADLYYAMGRRTFSLVQ